VSRLKLSVGDVFTLPIDDSRIGVGQIVGKYGAEGYYYIAIFDFIASLRGSVDIDDAVSKRVLFLALSLDAKLWAGHWELVGNRRVADQMPLPAFKEVVGTPDRVDVVDFSGERRRRASPLEAEVLSNRKVVAPVILEKALRAKFGVEPWLEIYTDLAPDEIATSARLFP
jgi:hypothetical protein